MCRINMDDQEIYMPYRGLCRFLICDLSLHNSCMSSLSSSLSSPSRSSQLLFFSPISFQHQMVAAECQSMRAGLEGLLASNLSLRVLSDLLLGLFGVLGAQSAAHLRSDKLHPSPPRTNHVMNSPFQVSYFTGVCIFSV